MRTTLTAIALLSLALSAQAQTEGSPRKIYVCEGYDYDDIELKAGETEFKYSPDGSSVSIGGESYLLADIDSITFAEPQYPHISVVFSESTAKVTIPASCPGVTASVSGAHVTLTNTNTATEYMYVLEGQSSNGSFTLNANYKTRILLKDLTLTSQKGAPIDIECGKRIEVKLQKGATVTLEDQASGAQKACFFTKGHLEIKGKGTLNITGNARHALCAKEYLRIKPSAGTINILKAANDGVHCGRGDKTRPEDCQFIMNGGILNIANCSKDCIDTDDYGTAILTGGTIKMEVAQQDGNGLKTDSILYMTGGDIVVNVTGDLSRGIRYNYDAFLDGGTISGTISGNGSKGIKAKKNTKLSELVLNGGDVHFRGTDVEFHVTGTTSSQDDSKCGGIRIDKDLYQTAGDLKMHVTGTNAIGIEVIGNTYRTGGTASE